MEHGPRFCQDFSLTGGKKPGRIQHQRSSMQSTGLPDGQEEAGLRQAHLRVSGSKLPIGLIRSLLQGTSSCQGLQSRSAYYGNKSLGRQPTARLYIRHGQETLIMNSPPGNQQGNSGVLIRYQNYLMSTSDLQKTRRTCGIGLRSEWLPRIHGRYSAFVVPLCMS